MDVEKSLQSHYSLRKKMKNSSIAREKKRGPKPKQQSWALSQYKRNEANAKERERQGVINTGFDKLREIIPHPGPNSGKCEKLRKIDILHVAISYIRALENILEKGDAGVNEFANSLFAVTSKEFLENSLKESNSESDVKEEPIAEKTKEDKLNFDDGQVQEQDGIYSSSRARRVTLSSRAETDWKTNKASPLSHSEFHGLNLNEDSISVFPSQHTSSSFSSSDSFVSDTSNQSFTEFSDIFSDLNSCLDSFKQFEDFDMLPSSQYF